MGIIELRMDGTGFTFIAEAVMVFLVAAIQHVDGGKLSFKTKFRHRFTAEIIFFHVELVNTHGHNAVGTAGFSDGFQAFFGKRLSCWARAAFLTVSESTRSYSGYWKSSGNFRTVGNGFETCVVFHIFTDDERHDGKASSQRRRGSCREGREKQRKRGSSHFKEFIHL